MAGLAPEGLQFDGRKFDAKMNELLQADGCDENLQEDLLRGISANVMVGLAPEGSQFDGCQFDAKSKELLQVDGGDEFLSSYHEDYDSLGLQENLPTGIYAYGFEKPSAIQQRGIVPSYKGLDVIQHAQSENAKFNPKCEIQPENEELTPEQYAIAEEWLQSIGFDKDFPSFDELLDKLDCMVYGCVKPSAIQQRRIVPSCKGLDVIQQAQSENTKFNPECKFQSLQSIKNELEKCVARGDLRRSKLR